MLSTNEAYSISEFMNHESAPLISVIVAVFNGRVTLQQCIDSVAQQTYPNKELIIIDGGSNDGTVELLEENRNKFSYWVSEPDRGIYNAWNKGLAQAQGEWICFLGADDYFWDDTVLERMAVQLQMLPTNIRVAYGQIMLISDDGQSSRPLGESWAQLKEPFKQYMNIPHVGTMHRRSLFEQHGKFDESFNIAGDYELLLRELTRNDAVFFPDIITAGQRLGGISTDTANNLRILQEVWRAQRMHGQLLPRGFLREELKRKYLQLLLWKVFGAQLGAKLLDLLFKSPRIGLHMAKLNKLLYILWSLKEYENRKKFVGKLLEYVDDITKPPQFLQTPPETPYKGEVLDLGINHKILLVVHEFSRTGAPNAVLYLARAIYSIYGVRPVVICPVEGPLREEFEREGFPTIVDPLLFRYRKYSSEACDFVAKFERVIVTSLASFDFIRYFRGIGKRLTWWIHETNDGFSIVINWNVDLPLLFAVCDSIWLGSPLCLPLASQYASRDKLHLLLYGCPDTVLPHHPHKLGKTVFLIVGTVDRRKGQDIFLDAIERLPGETRRKAIFRIIGSPLQNDIGWAFFKELRAKAAHFPEVEFFENMPPERLQEFYAETDVLVSASRDDPMPIAITQGLMYSKICLCSSAIGHAQLLKDKKDGLIFTSESAEELSEKMAWILQNKDESAAIGAAGRAVYEHNFIMSNFINNVENLIRGGTASCPA